MRSKTDRVVFCLAASYLALPICIFLLGWLRLPIAAASCAVLLYGVWRLMREDLTETGWSLTRERPRWIILVVLLLFVWVFLSGQGGFAFQNSDYQYRNAVLHDLIGHSWPVTYRIGEGLPSIAGDNYVLTYYIAFFLPSSLVGKLLGFEAAEVFSFFWSFAGILLVAYFLFRTLGVMRIRSVLVMIFFSGLDVFGYFLVNDKLPGATDHIEWWSGFQYSSMTTLLFWVFNQTIAIWLSILLLANMKRPRSAFFLLALLLLYGPFPCIGLFPYVLWKCFSGTAGEGGLRGGFVRRATARIGTAVRATLSVQNTLCAGILLLIVWLYYRGNSSASSYSGISQFLTPKYFLFIFLEAGVYLLILAAPFRKSGLFWITAGSLLLIPLFQVGSSQDFCMRVSIPALFVLQLLIQKALLLRAKKGARREKVSVIEKNESEITQTEEEAGENSAEEAEEEPGDALERQIANDDIRLLKAVLVVLLVVSAATPLTEINRAVWYTIPATSVGSQIMRDAGDTLADSSISPVSAFGRALAAQSGAGSTTCDTLGTLSAAKDFPANFLAKTEDNFFYLYLAKDS